MCAPFRIANWLRLDDENIGKVVAVLSEPIEALCSDFGICTPLGDILFPACETRRLKVLGGPWLWNWMEQVNDCA